MMRMMLMRSFAIFCGALAVILVTGALAQENPFENEGEEAPPSTAASEIPETTGESKESVVVTGKICNRVTAYVPADDVAYQPGVDVDGNAVAPADIPGSQTFELPDNIAFELPLNPFEYVGNSDLAEKFPDAQFSVGRVEYDLSSGKLTLNGKVLNQGQNAAIAAACNKFREEKNK